MRLRYALGEKAQIGGHTYICALRPLGEGNALENQGYGEENREKIRLLLPFCAAVHERDEMIFRGRTYLCIAVRPYPGHVQADFVRQAL